MFARLRGRGVLRPEDVDAALREVRVALLEADVELGVARQFLARVRERAVGAEVLSSLTPAQNVIRIVRDELAALMGEAAAPLALGGAVPASLLLVGLQGSGKTTAAAKLGRMLARQGRRPLLVALDLRRPAAVEQLRLLAEGLSLPVLVPSPGEDAPALAARAPAEARRLGCDVVIGDTAGRLSVDEALMAELERVCRALEPREVLLVVDAMTGQQAVAVARGFIGRVPVTGLVLTKLDGDARGGAALSLRAAVGRPIKLVGVGERPEALEVFHPDRMASRILGMGDVLSLIEQAQQAVDPAQAGESLRRLREAKFDLDDYLQSLRQLRRMGPLDNLLGMLPGLGRLGPAARDLKPDPAELKRSEAILSSMTPAERRQPDLLNASRRRRVARGSGTDVQDVNRLLRQYEGMRRMMRQVQGMARRAPTLPAGLAAPPPGVALADPTPRGTARPPRHGKRHRRR